MKPSDLGNKAQNSKRTGSLLSRVRAQIPLRTVAIPIASIILFAVLGKFSAGPVLLLVAAVALIATVLVAVYHAEVVAHRIGEPFGTLVLALAVTVIEVSIIVSMMLSDGVDSSGLARDTVFATVMIVCNGVIGLCLLIGALKHHVLSFRIEGTTPTLSVLATLATMTLVLPDFTFSTEGPTFSVSQLVFAAAASLMLYGVFIFVQTVRHKEYFLPEAREAMGGEEHPPDSPAVWVAWFSMGMLLVSLVGVVGLAEGLAPTIEASIARAGLPHAVLGIVIALMVLLPETTTAVRSARRNRMQISFNLALGSALATIGLTIPAVAVMSIMLDLPIHLGLEAKEIVLLALTLFLTAITLSGGRATILQGAVHLVVFAVFVFLTTVP